MGCTQGKTGKSLPFKNRSLVYFELGGRAEPIRMLLSLKQQKYEDVRVTQERFGELKEKQICTALPLWIEDGVCMNESTAILRALGVRHGLYPEDKVQAWKVDVIVGMY